MNDLAEKAERLRALHHASTPVIFVNAWDALSARIIEMLGFPAIATTSAGVAHSLGYPDGEQIPRELMLQRVKEIASAVGLPVTADVEAGYDRTEQGAADTVRALIACGGVGFNIEDATHDPHEPLIDGDLQARRIAAGRKAAGDAGVDVVINARTDAFWSSDDPLEIRLERTFSRAKAYIAAGADSIFVPGAVTKPEIVALVSGIQAPLNILAYSESPPIAELTELGVKRVSLGSSAMSYAMAMFRNAAREVRENGTYSFCDERIPYPELNAMFA